MNAVTGVKQVAPHRIKSQKLLYLSGAPRISTRADSETPGPRSHVLGVIEAFEALGWDVTRFIAGDHLPARFSNSGSERAITSSRIRTLAADILRILLAVRHRVGAARLVRRHPPTLIYERIALFQ